MIYAVKRYSLNKQLISSGQLEIKQESQTTTLIYADDKITETATEPYHPLVALESLRKKLETEHNSIISINGCRIDTAYRPTGGNGTYLIKQGRQATKSVSLFEPTMEVDKLCTVEEHEAAYDKWVESLMPKE